MLNSVYRVAVFGLSSGIALTLVPHPAPRSATEPHSRTSSQETTEAVPDWRKERLEARQALQRKDDTDYRKHLLRLLPLVSGNSETIYSLATTEARLGHSDAAMNWLTEYAAMGLTRTFDDAEFESNRGTARFRDLSRRLRDNGNAISHGQTAIVLGDPNVLAEDVAYDTDLDEFYISSVRERKIVAVQIGGRIRDFTVSGANGAHAMLALAADPNRRWLWATTSATPMELGYAASDAGRSALLKYDLRTGSLVQQYNPPDDLPLHAMGDMTVAATGDVFVSDGRAGILYVLRHDRDRLETLVGPDVLASPQTPAVAPDGQRVFVADYLRGIAVVDVKSGRTAWLPHPNDVAVNGIDGLYLVGRSLIAVQNGTTPSRVVRLILDSSLSRIQRSIVIESNSTGLGEPTHGVVVGRRFYFIANSGWDHFTDEGDQKSGATPPTIRFVSVRGY
jgi:hypothetical protein